MKLTKKQQIAVARLSERYDKPYKELRREVHATIGSDPCVMRGLFRAYLKNRPKRKPEPGYLGRKKH